jgi:hypothetical protein
MRFNAEKFPDWPLALTSLAAVQEERGEVDEAIESCKKALELSPGNDEARAILRRLKR